MTNHRTILQRLVWQECRSLAQYVGESWPWTHRGNQEAQNLVRSIMADEARWAEQLADLMMERGGQPTMGSYPDAFVHSNLHYVALDYLLHRLADYLQSIVETLRADSVSAADDPPLARLIEQMIERKNGQIEALRRLAASCTEPKIRAD